MEVIEPLQVLRVTCRDPDNGIDADVTFHGRVAPVEEPRFTRRVGSQTMMDYTRLTQNGDYSGSVRVQDTTIDLTRDRFVGTRDRSWGIRPIGLPDPQANPEAEGPQFFWLWAPLNFPQCATFYHLNADATGEPWNTAGVIAATEGQPQSMRHVSSRLSYRSGSRHASGAELEFQARDGSEHLIRLRPRYTFFMNGLGYGHPEWGHGRYHDELATGYEQFAIAEVDVAQPGNFHIQEVCDATLVSPDGEHQGRGVLEQMVIGPYAPYGFSDLADLAP